MFDEQPDGDIHGECVAEIKRLMDAIALAYGHLWHVNNEPMAPIPLRSHETAAYAARKVLRDLLTNEERGRAINRVQSIIRRDTDGGPNRNYREPTPSGWSDTDWIKHLQEKPHPLAGLHINQGSMDAAADAYEAEYSSAHNA